jgi:hypothetical protein
MNEWRKIYFSRLLLKYKGAENAVTVVTTGRMYFQFQEA